MKLGFVVYDALCSPKIFRINGIDAEVNDFGTHCDRSPETAEPYGCGDMRFEPKPSSKVILKKYKITQKEYDEVCHKLNELSFGACGWCV